MNGEEEPYYSERDIREGIEKIKNMLNKESSLIKMYSVGFWNFIQFILDKELLTYKQKKQIVRELFPFIETLKNRYKP